MRRAAACGAAAALVAGGCLPHKTGWVIDFEVSGDLERAVRVDVQILDGDCETGTEVYSETLFLPEGPHISAPPDLGKGDYCFIARASDVRCEVYAEDRSVVHLPQSGRKGKVTFVLSRLATPERLCDAGQSCIEGRCGPAGVTCAEGHADCNGSPGDGCETSLGRRASCGSCDRACEDFEECERLVNGTHQCIVACLQRECGEACTDTRADPLNCGRCGVVCPAAPNSTGRCEGGSCSESCLPGFSDCDGDGANGCETTGACS